MKYCVWSLPLPICSVAARVTPHAIASAMMSMLQPARRPRCSRRCVAFGDDRLHVGDLAVAEAADDADLEIADRREVQVEAIAIGLARGLAARAAPASRSRTRSLTLCAAQAQPLELLGVDVPESPKRSL